MALGDGIPTMGQVREYLDLPLERLPEDELERVWQSARHQQTTFCLPIEVPDEEYPAALVMALLRRTQRALAAKNLPLGYLADGDFGPTRLLSFDAIIEELESPWRRVVVA